MIEDLRLKKKLEPFPLLLVREDGPFSRGHLHFGDHSKFNSSVIVHKTIHSTTSTFTSIERPFFPFFLWCV